ncbi:helix-turn-helix domain-containing protein [Deinococcus wulumuqiensis]
MRQLVDASRPARCGPALVLARSLGLTSGGRITDDGIEAARRYLRVRGLTVGQVARVLRMNERTVRSWAERGTLDFQLIGGKRYLLTVHLVEWARSRGWVLFWEEVL